jgi:hypothetical protein
MNFMLHSETQAGRRVQTAQAPLPNKFSAGGYLPVSITLVCAAAATYNFQPATPSICSEHVHINRELFVLFAFFVAARSAE